MTSIRLRTLREAFRSVILAYVTGRCDATSIQTMRTAALGGALVVTIDEDGRTRLQARPTGVDGAVATLMGILHDAQVTGD